MIPKTNGGNKTLTIACVNEFGVKTVVTFSPLMLTYTITVGGVQYKSSGRKPFLKLKTKSGCIQTISFENALGRNHYVVQEYGSSSIISEYKWFHSALTVLPFTIRTAVKLYNNGLVRFFIEATNEMDAIIDSVLFPQALNFTDPDTHAHSIEPIDQGTLIFDNHYSDEQVKYIARIPRSIGSPLANMPFFGRADGEGLRNGYVAIIDTPVDAALYSSRGYSDSLLTATLWKASLGKVAYRRSVTYRFFDKMDYNCAAKYFRDYLKQNASLKTLAAKIAENPAIKDVAAAPLAIADIYQCVGHNSNLYKYARDTFAENPKLNMTFADVSELLDSAKRLGIKKLTVLLNGWGECGIDSKHPYVLPVCEKAGGFKGLSALASSVADKKYRLALLDNYRDFYLNCAFYDAKKAVCNADYDVEFANVNYGGKQAFLRADFAKAFIERTYRELIANGIKPDFVLLDGFTSASPDESFDKERPLTRAKASEFIADAYDAVTAQGFAAFGNKQGGLFADKIVLNNYAEFDTAGVPVPLYDLVYRDCFVMTHNLCASDVLRGFLYGRTPAFDASALKNANDGKSERLLADVKKMAELSASLCGVEMISHRFEDVNRTKETVAFANGIVITADFANNTCKIEK